MIVIISTIPEDTKRHRTRAVMAPFIFNWVVFLGFRKKKKEEWVKKKKKEKIEDADWLTFLGANFLFWKVIVIQEKKYFPFLEGDCNHS